MAKEQSIQEAGMAKEQSIQNGAICIYFFAK